MKSSALFVLAAALAACASPPVWRSPQYGPAQPVPTLAAASTFEFAVHTETINLTGVRLDKFAKAVGQYAADNPDKVIEGIGKMKDAADAMSTVGQSIAAAGPAMHQKAINYLESQGFKIEVDQARADKLIRSGRKAADFAYVAPGTAPDPFGSSGGPSGSDQRDRPDGQIPIWGTGSKSDLVERLATDRPREAYASIQAKFAAPGNNPANGMSCKLTIQVLAKDADLVFEGRTVGQSKSSFAEAFDSALSQMSAPVVE